MTPSGRDVSALYDSYLIAVNAESDSECAAALDFCVSDDFELTSFAPYRVRGRDAVHAKLRELATAAGDARLRMQRSGAVEIHFDTLRAPFEAVDGAGNVRLAGEHVGTVGADRLTSIAAFAERLPAVPKFADVRGKRIVVTGGSRGIGAAVVHELAAAGARVLTCGRDPDALAAVATSARTAGGDVEVSVVDVAEPRELDAFLQHALTRFGTVDVLVNNAGETALRDFLQTDEAAWERSLRVNLLAAVRTTRALLPGMVAQSWGRIVMVSSSGAKYPTAQWIDYSAAKAALAAAGKALAIQYGPANVLVNTVLPGLIRTDMTDRSLRQVSAETGRSIEALEAAWAKAVPVGRWGRPEQIASLIRFLCSDDADYINGAAIDIDGGMATHVY